MQSQQLQGRKARRTDVQQLQKMAPFPWKAGSILQNRAAPEIGGRGGRGRRKPILKKKPPMREILKSTRDEEGGERRSLSPGSYPAGRETAHLV